MSVFHRMGHFLSTTLILYIEVDPPKGYLKESLSIADFKKPNIHLLWRSPKSISKPENNWEKYLPVGSFLLKIRIQTNILIYIFL